MLGIRREPALLLSLVAILVKLATAFGLDLTIDQQSAINAVAAAAVGLAVAVIAKSDGLAAAVLGAAQAAIALAVGFGLHWSPDQQAVVMSLIAVLVGMFIRTQVTAPAAKPLGSGD